MSQRNNAADNKIKIIRKKHKKIERNSWVYSQEHVHLDEEVPQCK